MSTPRCAALSTNTNTHTDTQNHSNLWNPQSISTDWTRWFLNTIAVCSRYYFNSLLLPLSLVLHLKFNFCVLSLCMQFYLWSRLRLKAFNIRLCAFHNQPRNNNNNNNIKITTTHEKTVSYSIYLHIIDRGQILGNWMLFCVLLVAAVAAAVPVVVAIAAAAGQPKNQKDEKI